MHKLTTNQYTHLALKKQNDLFIDDNPTRTYSKNKITHNIVNISSSPSFFSSHNVEAIKNKCKFFLEKSIDIFTIKNTVQKIASDPELSDICQQGANLMSEYDNIGQRREKTHKKNFCLSLTPKQAILGGLLFSGATASTLMYLKWHNNNYNDKDIIDPFLLKTTLSDNIYIDQENIHLEEKLVTLAEEFSKSITDYIKESYVNIQTLSYSEYQKELNIINKLSVPNLNDIFDMTTIHRHSRSTRELNSKEYVLDYIPNYILEIIQDNNLDWHFSNELDLMFRISEMSPEVRKSRSKKEKNIILLLKFIQLLNAFLKEDEKLFPNSSSYKLGSITLTTLCNIANHLDINQVIDLCPKITEKGLSQIRLSSTTEKNIAGQFHREKKIYIPKEKNNKPTNEHKMDDVKVVSLIDCYNERENLNTSSILRVVSKTLLNPISCIVNESLIVVQYEYLNEGCKDNTALIERMKKIESKFNEILSLHPKLAKVITAVHLYAQILDMIADAIDGKEISIKKIASVEESSRSIFKTIVSSIPTNSKDMSPNEISSLTNQIFFKKDNIYIKTKKPDRVIQPKIKYNHFTDPLNGNYIFLEGANRWVVNKNIYFTNMVKETMEHAAKEWGNSDKITFIKNKSPTFYQDGILVSDGTSFYTLIDEKFTHVEEVPYNDRDYRYMMSKDSNEYTIPIIYKGGEWHPEDKTSSAVSDDLINLVSTSKIRNQLYSGKVKHTDVTPLTPGRDTQIDTNNIQYLKIDDQYYLLKMDTTASLYIEGPQAKLPLIKTQGKYNIVNDGRLGAIGMYRDKLINNLPNIEDKDIYFDSSLIAKIKKSKLLTQSKIKKSSLPEKINNFNMMDITQSKHVEGALYLDDMDYFNINGFLIKVWPNGDDTYTLFTDDSHIFPSLLIYKNIKSNTYYLKENEYSYNKIAKTGKILCRSKRQILSLCDAKYLETTELTSLLNTNKEQTVKINLMEIDLKPVADVSGLYHKINSDESFYYYKDNLYFHAYLEKDQQPDITPPFFSIYAKKETGEIDHSALITPVCLLKDFDTRQIVMSTPTEAQRIVLGIDAETSSKMLTWNKKNFHGEDVTEEFLDKLPELLKENQNIQQIETLFQNEGKKIIDTVERADELIELSLEPLQTEDTEIELITLDSASEHWDLYNAYDVFNEAFIESTRILKVVTDKLKTKSTIDKYCINKLNIVDERAQNLFYDGLTKRIERINIILNEEDRSNIFLIVPDRSHNSEQPFSGYLEHSATLGFTIVTDPLDRMIMNALVIPENFNAETKNFAGFTKRSDYINVATETMLHEAAHASGNMNELAYIMTTDSGRMLPIDKSINYLEALIATDQMIRGFRMHNKLYFASNPIYHNLKIEDLTRPENLHRIYYHDNYYKALLLLNAPDTLAIMIRELSELE